MYYVSMVRFKEFGKIILSLMISFTIVFTLSNYFGNSKNINFKKLTDNGKNLLSSVPRLFTINFGSSKNNLLPQKQWGGEKKTAPTIEPFCTGQNCSQPTIYFPSPTPYNLKPTIYLQPTSIPIPTDIPNPTKAPKPTRAPDVFPIDPSLVRPGKTTDEVFSIAGQKTCVPKEVLKAIAYIESGEFFSVVSPKYFLLYNSYNWWNSQFLTEEKRACGGYDFDNGSGLVEADSKFAGHNCHSDGSTGAQSYIFGPMQVSGLEQSKWGGQAAKLLGVSKVDRRVILDAITIVGVITKINVQPTSCTNWSGHDIVKAACGYYGSCGIADGTYYCNTFCKNYKRFGGKGSCDAASFGDNCWK